MSSVLPKKKVITTSVTCTKVPRPLRNLKLSKKKFSSGTLLESKKSQNSSSLLTTTSARSVSLSGFSFSSASEQNSNKVISPDEYYCESPPSGFGSSESSSRPLTGTPSAGETGTSVSVTPSSSSAKDSALSITSITASSSSPVGTNTPISGSTKLKDLTSSVQLEDDSGQGDYEEELQFSLVSSSSNFDLISNSEETESGSYSYSYTCSNSCCTTGCYSDDDDDDEEIDEDERSHSRSSSDSQSQSKRTISELNDSDICPSDDDETEFKESVRHDRGDSELENDRENSDKTFELYLKRVEKLKRVLSHWDTFLNENGISRPDFFCRYKERESLQQIIDDFQKITSRHREGLLSALKEDRHKGNVGLNGVDIEDTTSGSSDAKVRRNGWRNRRIRKLLVAGDVTGTGK